MLDSGQALAASLPQVDIGMVLLVAGAVLALVRPSWRTIPSSLGRVCGIAINAAALIAATIYTAEFMIGRKICAEPWLLPGLDYCADIPAIVGLPMAVSVGLLAVVLIGRLLKPSAGNALLDATAIGVASCTIIGVIVRFAIASNRLDAAQSKPFLTAVALIALVAAVAMTRSKTSVTRLLERTEITREITRPLLIAAVAIPLFAEFLVRRGEQSGFYGAAASTAVDTLLTTLTLVAMTLAVTRQVARIEIQREEAAGRLRESEARLQLQMRTMPVACIVRDREMRVQSWNPTAEAIFGWPEAAVLDGTLDMMIVPETRPWIEGIRRRTREGHFTPNNVGTVLKRDGTGVRTRWTNAPLKDAAGEFAGVISMVEDITTEEIAREALRQSEERYRNLVDNSPDAIVVHTGGVIRFANAAAAKLAGLESPEKALGRHLLEFIPEELQQTMQARLVRLNATGRLEKLPDVQIRRADGGRSDVEVTAIAIDYEGEFSILITLRDVTARKEAERARLESEERYRQLVDAAPEGIMVRVGTTIVFANRAAAALLHTDVESLIGRESLSLIAPEERDDVAERMNIIDSGRSAGARTHMWVRDDGSRLSVEIAASRVQWNGVTAAQVLFRDVTERDAAARALRMSEERYRRIIEGTNEAVLVMDNRGRIEFLNERACSMFGWTCAEVRGRYVPDVVATGEVAECIKVHLGRRQRGLSDRYECVLRRRSGESFFAYISAAPLISDGEFVGSVALISDITSSKLAEEKLRQSEFRYRDLVDALPNFIFSIDADHRYVAVNRASVEALGLTKEQIIGKTPADLGLPYAARWIRMLDKVFESAQAQTDTTTIALGDGRRLTVRATLNPVFDSRGKVTGVSGFGVDITKEKEAEQSVQRLMNALEQSSEIIFTTDTEGLITYTNPAFEKIYGYSREEAVGQTPRLLKGGEISAEQYAKFWRNLKDGIPVRTEYTNRAKDGSAVRVIASAAPVFGDSGAITGFIAVQQDVTDQRRAEEDRRQLDQRLEQVAKLESLGTLAGGIAHDFNNILNIILTYSAVIARRPGDAQRTLAAVDTIKQAVTRGAALSKQVLTFARRGESKREPVDAGKIAREVVSMISEMFPRTIVLTTDIEKDLPLTEADPGQIHQAILNLCVNARDAMPEGGSIHIAVYEESGRAANVDAANICISVCDTGCGMDEDVRDRIFEPFFTTKPKGKGTGLGLAVVYGIVQSHGGNIDVRSEPGGGTSFRLFFPAMTVPHTPAAIRAAETIRGGRETLMIVEDESLLRKVTASHLRDAGYRVLEASRGEEAIDQFRRVSGAVDVLVTDLGMPGISPLETIRTLRLASPHLPVIAVTGYLDPELHESILAAVSCILQKPFDPDDLLGRVREVLDASGEVTM